MTVSIGGASVLRLNRLSDDESGMLKSQLDKLSQFQNQNSLKAAYYEGTQAVQQFGISIPPQMQGVKVVSGWAGTTVDVLEERLDWEGWIGDEDGELGLAQVYRANRLGSNSSMAHIDALVYGVAFVVVGKGGWGEPDPLVTVESARHMTGTFDPRQQRLSSAVWQYVDPETREVTECALYLPNETIRMTRSSYASQWHVLDRDQHGLGRVPVARMANRPRAGDLDGRSEVTEGVRYLVDHSVRAMHAMETAREYYSSPQRYVLGASEDAFEDQAGNPVSGWSANMARVLGLSRDEDGNMPEVGQFPQGTQGPYAETLRILAAQLSAEAGIPQNYLGQSSDGQAASADAIKAMEARLIKRAERRQTMFGDAWLEVARLSLLVRDGEIPDDFFDISCKWRDPSTPTRAAAADEAVKLISAGVLTPDSGVTMDRIGLSTVDQERLTADKRRGSLQSLLQRLPQVESSPEVDALAATRVVDADDG